MQLLPAELKCRIVELSSGSPSSLAALARTHTAFQREAEKALYDTLCIRVYRDDSLKCMETLATNSEKAALVRFLIIEYALEIWSDNNLQRVTLVTSYLSKSLINMQSLSDFRVKSRCGASCPGAKMIERLGKIFWSVCKILIFSKLTILMAIKSRSFSITNFLLPRRGSQHFSNH